MIKCKALILVSLLCCTSDYAATIWEQDRGNSAHTGYIEQSTNPAKYRVLWTKDLNYSFEDSFNLIDVLSPIITSDRIYLTINHLNVDINQVNKNKNEVLALDTISGNTVWRNELPQQLAETVSINDTLYLLAIDKSTDTAWLNSYRINDGVLKFSNSGYDKYSQLMNYKQELYAVTNAMYLLDLETGQNTNRVKDIHSENYFIAANDNYFYGISQRRSSVNLGVYKRPNGEADFLIKIPGFYISYFPHTYPVLDNKNNAVYFPLRRENEDQYSLYAFDLASRSIKWILPNVRHQVALADNDIYAMLTDSHGFYELACINAVTSKIQWSWKPENQEELTDEAATNSPPVITTDVIFVAGATKTYAISRATHQKIWEIDTSGMLALGNHMLYIIHHPKYTFHQNPAVTAVALN